MFDAFCDLIGVGLYLAACGLVFCAGWMAWDYVIYRIKKAKQEKSK